MAAYRRVYDSRHLQADCQEPGSAPESYTLGNRVRATFSASGLVLGVWVVAAFLSSSRSSETRGSLSTWLSSAVWVSGVAGAMSSLYDGPCTRHATVYSTHLFCWGRGDFPVSPKNLQFLPAAKLCALNVFFGRDNELQIYEAKISFHGRQTQEIIRH